MAGIIVFAHSCLDMEHIMLNKYHYTLYYLALAMYPRMLFTLNNELENMPITVRVG